MSEPVRTIGQLAQVACTWEVQARKAGNVCPGREFPDLTVDDFLRSAAAIAPVLDQAPHQPLGVTILRCIEETRKVVTTNTNLGIVLLLAPLASVPLDEPLEPALAQGLERTTVEDSRNVYAAIRLANPGGLGKVKEQDVRLNPTLPLRDVMALACDRDAIAREYASGFGLVCYLGRPCVDEAVSRFATIERLIIELHLDLLSCHEDSLVARKLGTDHAKYVTDAAHRICEIRSLETPEGRSAYLKFDAWLRSENHARNPGTTADLIAAALFVALREKRIPPLMAFEWQEHPFASEPTS